MARENQGLQIALILFVTVTIVLSVTTYLGMKWYSDEIKARQAASEAGTKSEQKAMTTANEVEELKKVIGAASTENLQTIKETFAADMKKWGAAYPETALFYRPLLEKMQLTIEEKNRALDAAKDEIPKLTDDYKSFKEGKDQEVAKFRESSQKTADDLAGEQAKFQDERRKKNEEVDGIQTSLVDARKKLTDSRKKAEDDAKATKALIAQLKDLVTDQSDKIAKITSDKVGAPNGEITWVNQRNATVWLNLGRADSLQRQVTFSVYPSDVTDMTAKGARKAMIEVTQILGDHFAEARVLDDTLSNPIMPGDKIFTPVWNPGEKRHFALAGLMDVDGDGRSDLQTVLNLIAINGGAVDCYVTDAGKLVGQITINTNCLILGDAPTEKSGTGQRESFTKVLRDADQLRLQRIQLADLLQRMGWKNLSPVIQFGRGANPKDFIAKPPEGGVPKKSTGSVSDVFKKRQPPLKTPASAF
jgi:hypothetical protein